MWQRALDDVRATGRPVLITGHTGFKGTWLTLFLESQGIELAGVSLPPEPESLFSALSRNGKIREFFTDIRNLDSVMRVIHEVNPAVIFHLAAQPLVIKSYSEPLRTFETNVMGTANILESVSRMKEYCCVVVATTDKVYQNLEIDYKYKENDKLKGKDPYSASKVGTESVVTAWMNIWEIESPHRICSVRAGNVIGGGDSAENRLIPDLIRGFKDKTAVHIRNPKSSRPWQHVLDPLSGYISSAGSLLRGESVNSFNFGPTEKSLPVESVLNIARSEFGSEIEISVSSASVTHFESGLLDLDSSLAREVLGWRPQWNQEEAIKLTFSWWKEVLTHKSSPFEACMKNISDMSETK